MLGKINGEIGCGLILAVLTLELEQALLEWTTYRAQVKVSKIEVRNSNLLGLAYPFLGNPLIQQEVFYSRYELSYFENQTGLKIEKAVCVEFEHQKHKFRYLFGHARLLFGSIRARRVT